MAQNGQSSGNYRTPEGFLLNPFGPLVKKYRGSEMQSNKINSHENHTHKK